MSKTRVIAGVIMIAAVLLIGGILAYFTDTDTKTNVFTIGDNVEISLSETGWTNSSGTTWTNAGANGMHPSDTIAKAPVITNDSTTTPAYVFAEVIVPCYASSGTTVDTPLFSLNSIGSGWTLISASAVDTTNKTVTYVYAYGTSSAMTSLAPSTSTTAVFSSVTVAPTLTQAQYNTASATPNIVVNAYGIQTENLGVSTPAGIYAMFHSGYYVKFDANGGTGTMPDQMIASGASTPLVYNTFTSSTSGYVFKGWNTRADGAGTSYTDAQSVTDLAQTGENITLYAQYGTAEIGDAVKYSTNLNGQTLKHWRVFYKETKGGVEYTYIILGDYLPNAAVSSTVKTNYNLADGNGIYSIKSTTNRTDLINAMTTKSNWDSLLSGTLNGTTVNETRTANVWAMGAPTLELWVNSWNAKYTSDTLYTKYENPVSGRTFDGWYIGNTEKPTTTKIDLSSKTGYGDTLYYPHQAAEQSCNGYWLASPSAAYAGYVMYVYSGGRVGSSTYYGPNFGFRPVVCLPSSVLE